MRRHISIDNPFTVFLGLLMMGYTPDQARAFVGLSWRLLNTYCILVPSFTQDWREAERAYRNGDAAVWRAQIEASRRSTR